jgi:RNA polymerase sigma factor (sigma-70 family)
MAAGQLGALLRHLLRTGERQAEDGSDRHLLERFVRHADEAAFAALVERHGRLVLGVCRGVLRHAQDAEDAFQATFLVLARMASTIRKRDALANWLYGVALRTARKARQAMSTRRRHEQQARPPAPEPPVAEAALHEVQIILHEEVERLPEKFRRPFVLCCLGDRSRAEAARELGWKEGTVSGRIAQARALLQARLARRGVALSAALTAAALTPAGAPAAVARAAVAFAAGRASNAVSAEAAALARGVVRALFVTKLQVVAGVALALALVLGGGLLARSGSQPPEGRPPGAAPAPAQPEPGAGKVRTDALGDPLPPGVVARMGSVRLWHAGMVMGLSFTPSGKLASGGADATVRLWDGPSGKELLRVPAGESWVRGLAVSRDEKLLAAGGDAVFVWDTATGKRLRRLQHDKVSTYSVAFAPDGKRLVSGDGDHVFRLWDLASGKVVRTFAAGDTFIPPVAFSPDGTALAAGVRGTVHLWDTATGAERRRLQGHRDIVYALAFSPGGKVLASGSVDKTVRLWELASGKVIHTLKGHTHQILSVSFSPDGRLLASAGGDNRVRIWDVVTGQERLQIRQGFGEEVNNVNAVAFAPDGATLAAGSNYGRIRLWDVATGKEVLPPRGHDSQVTALAFTPDGRQLITGAFSGGVIAWDATTGRELRTYARDRDRIFAVAVSPDGKALAAGSGAATRVWKTATGEEILKVGGAGGHVGFLPGGRLLAAHSWRAGKLWDLASGRAVGEAPAGVLAATPDGHLLYQKDASLFLHDPTTRRDRVELKLPVPRPPRREDVRGKALFNLVQVNAAAVSRDGKTLATASQAILTNKSEGFGAFSLVYEENIHIWDASTGKLRQKVSLPVGAPTLDGRIDSLAFSPDGRTLAGGGRRVRGNYSSPALVLFWDARTGKQVHKIQVPPQAGVDNVTCLAFSPDGTALATGGCDTTALVWQLPPVVGRRARGGG